MLLRSGSNARCAALQRVSSLALSSHKPRRCLAPLQCLAEQRLEPSLHCSRALGLPPAAFPLCSCLAAQRSALGAQRFLH